MYLLNFDMTDVALLLVLLSPVEMFNVHMLLQLLLRHELLLTQVAHRPNGEFMYKKNSFSHRWHTDLLGS
jgi:hypothetical protein